MSDTRLAFDDTDDRLEPDAERTEPVVWLRKLVILRSVQAAEDPIRVVELRRGLNIIGTEQPRADDGPVGHDVGKTLFTRLVRYCLGEPTFARDRVRKAIANAVPEGFVLAEVVVSGRCWVVARPIGEGRPHEAWCIMGDDWRSAVMDQDACLKWSQFQEAIAESTVAQLSETLLPHASRPVRWQDLLAWLSRDQYCRYRDPLEWRNAATESGTTELHAEDASILIRLVMDLLDEEERTLIDLHKQLLDEKARKSSEVVALTEDIARTRRFLDQRLRIDDDLLTDDLFAAYAKRRATRRQRRIESQIRELDQTTGLASLREDLEGARDTTTRLQQEIDTRKTDREMAEAELANHQSASRDSYLQSLADLAHPCTLPIGECPLKGDDSASAEENPLRSWLIQQKTADIQRLDQEIASLEERLSSAVVRFREVKARCDEAEREFVKRQRVLSAQAARIQVMVTEANGYLRSVARLGEMNRDLVKNERRVTQSRDSQRAAREQIARKHRVLNGHFNHVVKRLLGASADGRIEISMKGIRLVTDDQKSSHGEAMATSGTVHSLDMACLRASIAGLGSLPRFLIHDSPREGDLEPHIYARLFSLAVELESSFGSAEPSFQYIIATTTPPPKQIAKSPYLRLVLDARHRDGLLLKLRF